MRAWLALREGVHYRRQVFERGLEAAGFAVTIGLPRRPSKGDVLVIWNRYRDSARMADSFELEGLPVLVAENASWGNEFAGERWYSLARGAHNTAGRFPEGGAERWDGLGIPLSPWRRTGGEIVVLPQRGIGPVGVAMPPNWTATATAKLRAAGEPHRVRPHPGQQKAKPLLEDLFGASRVVTWGSGAAIKALMAGIPVQSDMPGWIGAQDNTDAGRLAMFRRLAWAQWTMTELASGVPFRRLLCES